MLGSSTFRTILPPKLYVLHAGVLQDPKIAPSSTSLSEPSPMSSPYSNVVMRSSRKRSRDEAAAADLANPSNLQSCARNTSFTMDQNYSESPVSLTNTQYRLASGLATLTTARRVHASMAVPHVKSTDVQRQDGREERSRDTSDTEVQLPIPASALTEENGCTRLSKSPGLRDAMYQMAGIAGRVWDFCKFNPFRGFYAGIGQGYEMRCPLQTEGCDRSPDKAGTSSEYLGRQERELTPVPGQFPEEDFIPDYMSQDHSTPPRVVKRTKYESGCSQISANWVKVPNADAPHGSSPTRVSYRKIPTASTCGRRSGQKLGRRLMCPEGSRRTCVGSTDQKIDRFVACMSPTPSTVRGKQGSPASVEVKRHAARVRRRKLEEDASLKRFNQQLKAMIREGKEALCTNFEVEDEDDEDDELVDESCAWTRYMKDTEMDWRI